MKDETKKKIKKGVLIALQVTLGGFALFGMISTGALVKSCSKGEINTTAVVATTPVVGQRVKKLNVNDVPSDLTYSQLVGTTWTQSDTNRSVAWWSNWNNYGTLRTGNYSRVYLPLYTDKVFTHSTSGARWQSLLGFSIYGNSSSKYEGSFMYLAYKAGESAPIMNVPGTFYRSPQVGTYTTYAQLNNAGLAKVVQNSDSIFRVNPSVMSFTFTGVENNPYTGTYYKLMPAREFVVWALNNGYTTDLNFGTPITYDYAYCSPVGTLPSSVPNDYTSVTLQFQADTGYGFPDTAETISGYTQIYSEGLVIDSYQYGGYLGNGLYNAIEIQCSRDSDPPADSCHIAVSAIATEGFVYPEWKTLRVQGTHCTIYMADSQFDSDGVVHLQAYPDTGYYFDQDRAFIGNQLKEYYGAEVIMYDLSTGGLYLTVRKNTENLVVNQFPYIEITPLAGNVPVGGSEMGQAFDLLKDGFAALLPLFMIQVLPGITLGMLFMVPFIVILIMFILKVVHK